MIRFLLAIALLMPFAADAVTLYYSRCDTGAHASCVAGSDANDGLSAASPKLTAPTSTQFNAAACGDQFLFAQGGRWDGYASGQINHGQNCASNPIVIGSYAPPSGATGRPKLFNGAVTGSMFDIGGNYNNISDDRGYTLRGLEIFSDATATLNDWSVEWGVLLNGTVSYVTLEDMDIHHFRLGVYLNPRDDNGLNNSINHVTIKNSTIRENYSMGILGTALDWVVEGNTFTGNNFSGSGFNHALYINSPNLNTYRVTFRRNTVTNNSLDILVDGDGVSNVCEGGNLTMHGYLDKITVEDNLITQDNSDGGCYGISITTGYPDSPNELFTDIIVRRNTVVNMGECAICVDSIQGAIIENNVTVNLEAYPSQNICVFTAPGGDSVMNNNVIRNNSCFHANGGNAYGMNTVNLNAGTGNVVANNLIVFGASAGARYCHWQEAVGAYSAYVNNWCYSAGGAGTFAWSQDYGSLASAQAAGFDANGTMGTDPLLAATPSAGNGYSMQLQSGSPAIGAGSNTYCARLTKDGKVRTGNCTVGAYQPGL